MNFFLRNIIIAVVIGILSFPTTVYSVEDSIQKNNVDKLDAKGIIVKMAETYKKCKTYLDSGVVNTTFFMKKGPYIDKVSFSTAFKRPGQFRFAYSSQAPKPKAKVKHHIILVKDKEVFVWQNAESGIEKESSLGDAIADAVGTSGGASQTIPVLIGANAIGGRSLADLCQLKRMKDVIQNGAYYYCIQGKRMASDTNFVTLLISRKTFLIHRIDSSQKFSDFRTETTKIYSPQINVAIDESKLTLNAPEKNKE